MATELLGNQREFAPKADNSMNSLGNDVNQRDLAGIGVALAKDRNAEPMPETEFAGAFPRHEPKTILLVEDEAFLRQAIAEALESAGYRMLVANSGNAALETFKTRLSAVDLLLTDLVMPGISGHYLATEFEHLYPQACVLLMSGHSELAAGFRRPHENMKFLAKPFSVRTLLDTVRELLNLGGFD